MKSKILLPIILLLCIGLVSAVTICSDTNEIDISDIPCLGFTPSVPCAGNITAFNTTNSSINYSIQTYLFSGNIYNFTLNLSRGSYVLVDCNNDTATIIIGLFDQGYGVNMFILILPAILLSFILVFVSGRLFNKANDEDEEEHERHNENNSIGLLIPKSRLIPILVMLFSFIPLIMMLGIINMHLDEYLGSANVTEFYGWFFVLISYLFFAIALFGFIVWLSEYIKKKKIARGLMDDYE